MSRSTWSCAAAALVLLALPAARSLAESRARAAEGDYRQTVGHLAARIVGAAGADLGADELSQALTRARVISADEARKLLEAWGREAEPARRALRAKGAWAVLLAAPEHSYLYVPGLRKANTDREMPAADAGFLLDNSKDAENCSRCGYVGNRNQACECTLRCVQIPCPPAPGTVGDCTHGCPQSADWTPSGPWTDPIPWEYRLVRQLFGGPDPRFLCNQPASGLEPGQALFASCPAVR